MIYLRLPECLGEGTSRFRVNGNEVSNDFDLSLYAPYPLECMLVVPNLILKVGLTPETKKKKN